MNPAARQRQQAYNDTHNIDDSNFNNNNMSPWRKLVQAIFKLSVIVITITNVQKSLTVPSIHDESVDMDAMLALPKTNDNATAASAMTRTIYDGNQSNSPSALHTASSLSSLHYYTDLFRQEDYHFVLGDGSYYRKVSSHRGGWGAIMHSLVEEQGLVLDWKLPTGAETLQAFSNHQQIQYNATQFTANHTNTTSRLILLLDISEKWNFSKTPLTVPWLGITHFGKRAAPRRRGIQNGLFALPGFLDSMKYNIGMVGLTASVQQYIKRTLAKEMRNKKKARHHHPQQQDGYFLNVCQAYHPIAVESEAVKYDPTIDLPATFVNHHDVSFNATTGRTGGYVLLGQQYRRLSTIHKLQTNGRPKMWLHGAKNEDTLRELVRLMKLEIQQDKETVDWDPTLQLVYTSTYQEYDELVKRNFVIVDLWDATANNAVMEAIALHAPFFVRRLPGTEEYLGRKYPLLFDNFEQLQSMIQLPETDTNDTNNSKTMSLQQRMYRAHVYLRDMDKSKFSLTAFGQALTACASKGIEKQMIKK